MTPYSLAFYLDVVTTGTVLGARPTDPPERLTEILGTDYAENVSGRHHMWRDHGLVEFFWERGRPTDPWSGHHFTLQVHRLAQGRRSLVNATLRDRYGRFAPRLRYDRLRRLLDRRGVRLVEIPEVAANVPYFRTFWQPESRVAVRVIGTYGLYSTPEFLRVGDVHSIEAPVSGPGVAPEGTQG